jgi:hypothetical protein
MRTRRVACVAAATVVAPLAYLVVGRKPCLTWGAAEEEVDRLMPGDDLLANPDIVSTRAISIDAPPATIWPWLVQMGPGRGGVYTYDWIENLFGLNMHSAEEILPQFQDLRVGDVQSLGSKGPRLRVEVLDAEKAMVLRSEDGNWVWAFALYREGERTRLVSRNRIATPGASRLVRVFNIFVMAPGSLIMERKMLLGIRRRAEHLAHPTTKPASESRAVQGLFKPVDYSGRTPYRRPPATYLRLQWLGPLVTASGMSPKYVVTLEVPGRRSGVIRRTTLVRATYEDHDYLVALAGESEWVRNVRAAGGRVRIGRKERHPVRLVELPPEQRAPVIQAYLLRAGRRPGSRAVANEARYYFGVSADPSVEEIERIVQHYPVFRIEPEGASDE